MAFYQTNLGVLVVLNALLFYRQRRSSKRARSLSRDPEDDEDDEPKDFVSEADTTVSDFVKQYLVGHLLAFAADWLQASKFYIRSDISIIVEPHFLLIFWDLTLVMQT